MNTDRLLERRVASLMGETAPAREPDRLLDAVLSTTARMRPRPRWLALLKEPPMRISNVVGVGSPTLRMAYLLIVTLLLVMVATGAVVAGASLLPGTAIVVAQDGSGDHLTLTEAVAAARDGDTIMVRPGVYLENVTVDEDITVRGEGDRARVIVGARSDGPLRPIPYGEPVPYAVLLQDSNATILDLTIAGPATGVAVIIEGGAPVLERLDIESGAFTEAFRIHGGSRAVIRDSAWAGYIKIAEASSPTFQGNVITAGLLTVDDVGSDPIVRGNTFLDGAAYGASAGAGGLVEDNDVSGGGWIALDSGSHATIRGNRISGALAHPVGRGGAIQIISLLGDTSGQPVVEDIGEMTALVEGNQIADSAYGIEIFGLGALPIIRGNTVRGSSGAAIIIENEAAPTIEGNVLEDSTIGVEVGTGTTPVIVGNRLCHNETDMRIPDQNDATVRDNTSCADAVSPSPGV